MKQLQYWGRRTLSVFLALVMCVSLLNLTVFANEIDKGQGHEHTFACYPRTCTEEHQHTKTCYDMSAAYACGIEEGAIHIHNEGGFECVMVLESGLICGLEETGETEASSAKEEVSVEKEPEAEEPEDTEDETKGTEDKTEYTEGKTEDTEDKTENTEDETKDTEDETEDAEDETEDTEDETKDTEGKTEGAEDETENAGDETEDAEDETEDTEDETKDTEDETGDDDNKKDTMQTQQIADPLVPMAGTPDGVEHHHDESCYGEIWQCRPETLIKIETVEVEDKIAKEGCLEAVVTAVGEDDQNFDDIDKVMDATYQWYMNGEPIQGATGSTLDAFDSFGNAVVAAPNTYYVEVAVGDREPVLSDPYQAVYYAEVQNGSFEYPGISSEWANYKPDTQEAQLQFGWKTTASDGKFEIFRNGSGAHLSGGTVQDGNYAIELNANEVSVTYQAILTRPGSTINWSFWHRARGTTEIVGFYACAEEPATGAPNCEGEGAELLYRSTVKPGEGWDNLTGSYMVPDGQYVTYFAFADLKSKTSGNLLDDVQITAGRITASDGPIGTIEAVEIYDDIATEGCLKANMLGSGINPEEVTYQWYEDGYKIIGASNPTLNVFDDEGRPVVLAPHQYYVEARVGDQVVSSTPYRAIYSNVITNNDFVYPRINSSHYQIIKIEDLSNREQIRFGWKSTTDEFELFNRNSIGNLIDHHFSGGSATAYIPGNEGIPIDDGQAAELNANVAGALYQAVLTYPGSEVHWSLYHRGRAGEDTMAAYIGGTEPTETSEGKVADTDFWETYADGNDDWVYHGGTYEVPEGQYITYFSFKAVDSTPVGNTNLSFGNLLANIQLPSTDRGPNTEPLTITSPSVTKIVEAAREGVAIPEDNEFQFRISLKHGVADNVKLLDGDTVTVENVTKESSKSAKFGDIMFEAVGTYVFEIAEVMPEDALPGYTYDPAVYTMTVRVEKVGRELKATLTYAKIENGVSEPVDFSDGIVTLTFTNKYAQPKLTSIEKVLVTEQSQIPDTVKAGDVVTLIYKIIVTGDEGASYVISDEGVELAEGSSWEGTLDESGKAEIYVTKTVIVEESDLVDGKATIANTAYVKPGDGTDPIEPNDPENDPTDPEKGYPSNEVVTEIPEKPGLTSIEKELVTEQSQIPDTVKAGDVVTLTYKIIVKGDKGARYVISDEDVELAEDSSWEGTLDESGKAEIYVTKTVIVEEADIVDGKVTITNTAYVKPGDGTDPIKPDDPENDPTDPEKGYPSNEVVTEIPVDDPEEPETPPEEPETPPETPVTPPEEPGTPPETPVTPPEEPGMPPETFEPEGPTTPETSVTPETTNFPAERIEVPNGDVPLANLTPEELLDIFSEVPLVETVMDDLVDIFTETPLADLTVDDLMDILVDIPLADLTPEELLDIFDNVPLSNVPKTGDNSQVWEILALVSGLGLVWLALGRKKIEDIAE